MLPFVDCERYGIEEISAVPGDGDILKLKQGCLNTVITSLIWAAPLIDVWVFVGPKDGSFLW